MWLPPTSIVDDSKLCTFSALPRLTFEKEYAKSFDDSFNMVC